MEEIKNQLIQTGFTLDRLHQDKRISDEAYTILKNRNKQAINFIPCCTELKCDHEPKNPDKKYTSCKNCEMHLQMQP